MRGGAAHVTDAPCLVLVCVCVCMYMFFCFIFVCVCACLRLSIYLPVCLSLCLFIHIYTFINRPNCYRYLSMAKHLPSKRDPSRQNRNLKARHRKKVDPLLMLSESVLWPQLRRGSARCEASQARIAAALLKRLGYVFPFKIPSNSGGKCEENIRCFDNVREEVEDAGCRRNWDWAERVGEGGNWLVD